MISFGGLNWKTWTGPLLSIGCPSTMLLPTPARLHTPGRGSVFLQRARLPMRIPMMSPRHMDRPPALQAAPGTRRDSLGAFFGGRGHLGSGQPPKPPSDS
jgi:hypothetical protein